MPQKKKSSYTKKTTRRYRETTKVRRNQRRSLRGGGFVRKASSSNIGEQHKFNQIWEGAMATLKANGYTTEADFENRILPYLEFDKFKQIGDYRFYKTLDFTRTKVELKAYYQWSDLYTVTLYEREAPYNNRLTQSTGTFQNTQNWISQWTPKKG